MPGSAPSSTGGVTSTPLITAKTLLDVAPVTRPRVLHIRASSAPARWASSRATTPSTYDSDFTIESGERSLRARDEVTSALPVGSGRAVRATA